MYKLWMDGILLMSKITEMIVGVSLGVALGEFLDADEELFLLVDELLADNDAIVNQLQDLEDCCNDF